MTLRKINLFEERLWTRILNREPPEWPRLGIEYTTTTGYGHRATVIGFAWYAAGVVVYFEGWGGENMMDLDRFFSNFEPHADELDIWLATKQLWGIK